jgi:uncharacterized protein DUF6538
MPTPYLFRRGDTFAFRIAVPADLRDTIGVRELVRSLRTPDRRTARPLALQFAAKALTLFTEIRAMPDEKREGLRVDFGLEVSLDELGLPKVIKITDAQPGDAEAISAITRAFVDAHAAHRPPTLLGPAQIAPAAQGSTAALMLSAVINDYLATYPANKKAMLAKHKIALPAFLAIVGDKPVPQIRQADIKRFFAILNKLPGDWKHQCDKRRVSPVELAELEHAETLAKRTFDDGYRACIRKFLADSQRDLHDQGFPTSLTTDGCDYQGNRSEGGRTQRAMKPEELRRLFEGPEIRNLATNTLEIHKFWLPVLGLYTGSRVNELAQINPQTDVFQDPKTGIWCVLLTEETEAGDGIEKSIKTAKNRAVPMHCHLIELGFPAYVDAIKRTGAKQLFPAWAPRGGRAAPNAIAWFSEFLDDIGLHGVANEKGRVLLGTHCFRHTLLTYGKRAGVNLRCISGHAERSNNPVADGYEDETILLDLTEKRDRLAKLDYGLDIPVPVLPLVEA